MSSVASEALRVLIAGAPSGIPETSTSQIAMLGVAFGVDRREIDLMHAAVHRVISLTSVLMTGLAEIGAAGKQQEASVVRYVGVVAHVAVLAVLAVHRVLARRPIEDVRAAGDGAVVAAVTERCEPGQRTILLQAVLPDDPAWRRVGYVARLAGRDAVRRTEIVLSAGHASVIRERHPSAGSARQEESSAGDRQSEFQCRAPSQWSVSAPGRVPGGRRTRWNAAPMARGAE